MPLGRVRDAINVTLVTLPQDVHARSDVPLTLLPRSEDRQMFKSFGKCSWVPQKSIPQEMQWRYAEFIYCKYSPLKSCWNSLYGNSTGKVTFLPRAHVISTQKVFHGGSQNGQNWGGGNAFAFGLSIKLMISKFNFILSCLKK